MREDGGVLLYHRTEHAAAIMAEGFRSAQSDQGIGVWFADNAGRFSAMMTGHGDEVVVIDVPDDIVESFRYRAADGEPLDMFFVPGERANDFPRHVIPYAP